MVGKSWKTFQIIQFRVFLFTRTVDGHGVQTLEVKRISFAVWGIFNFWCISDREVGFMFIRTQTSSLQN